MKSTSEEKSVVVRNIILQTVEEQERRNEDAYISDKNTASSSPDFDDTKPKDYNYVPFQTSPIAGVQADNKTEDQAFQQNSAAGGRLQTQKAGGQIGGETAPFLYDPAKETLVNMDSSGNINVAAEAKNYAAYFLAMQEKIGKFHKEFFPIYQYYQGLLRDGVVVVDFTVNKNGDVVKADIVSSYGSDTVDQASLNSIVFAKNFGPLPPELAKYGEVKVRFNFVYFSR